MTNSVLKLLPAGDDRKGLRQREVPLPPLIPDAVLDPQTWNCSVCGKVRARELLHSKAILGQQQLVCAPSCLGAERRANGR